ncbi:MAG: hypothetical protein C4519_08085 [Desulfobacteraceae bacterium]|nr:MAG: hypothetical protein C4519_08085 [Desulfobacteraceae bacterium]
MRGNLTLLGAVLIAVLLSAACAKPAYIRSEQRPAYIEAPEKSGQYVKKAVIAVRPGAPTQAGRPAEDLFLQVLIKTIKDKNRRLTLIAPDDAAYPAFMKIYHPISPRDAFTVAQTARRQGYHSIVQAAVENIRVYEEKTGLWWFRKNRYFLTVVVSMDVFDTFTAAKMAAEVRERTVKIDADNYAALLAGSPHGIEAVQALIADMAKDLGGLAAGAIGSGRWITSVAEVHNPHISLTSGLSAGLRVGDRFSVFEGRRIINGLEGEKFIVPGYAVAEIQITQVDENSATASFSGSADIQPGDIAVPAGR